MNQEQIEKLAKQAGFKHPDHVGLSEEYAYFDHKKFAELVAKEAKLECAELCRDIGGDKWALYKGLPPYTHAQTGRSEQYTHGLSDGADLCADAIENLVSET